jgi:hypothetical protein
MENLYQGIPTYYIELIKKGQEEIKHINARINQLCGCLDFAKETGSINRINEINAQITELAKRELYIKEKIESYTRCQCNACKM